MSTPNDIFLSKYLVMGGGTLNAVDFYRPYFFYFFASGGPARDQTFEKV
jgi:hypothetical protein